MTYNFKQRQVNQSKEKEKEVLMRSSHIHSNFQWLELCLFFNSVKISNQLDEPGISGQIALRTCVETFEDFVFYVF